MAITTEIDVHEELAAAHLGPVEYLSPEEADAALAIEKEIERPRQFWKTAAREARAR